MRISDVFKEDIGLGGVVSLLWFKRRMFSFSTSFTEISKYPVIGLPPWATKFIEMVLMLTADHGPAVSGYVAFFIQRRVDGMLTAAIDAVP
jgi:ATP citrate (pro-S)-lyase